MICPNCKSLNIKVTNTRSSDTEVYRRRDCKVCGFSFYTTEKVDNSAKAALSRIHSKLYNK